jgi:hypothetical protein
MFDGLGVKVPYPNLMEVKDKRNKGRHREWTSEGSVEQSRDPTNRNRIRGILGRTSGPPIAKSGSMKRQGCRSGGGATKTIEFTWEACTPFQIGTEEVARRLTGAHESAEGIVGHAGGKASEALQTERRSKRIGHAGLPHGGPRPRPDAARAASLPAVHRVGADTEDAFFVVDQACAAITYSIA